MTTPAMANPKARHLHILAHRILLSVFAALSMFWLQQERNASELHLRGTHALDHRGLPSGLAQRVWCLLCRMPCASRTRESFPSGYSCRILRCTHHTESGKWTTCAAARKKTEVVL